MSGSSNAVGKCEEIKDHVYHVLPGKSFDIYAKTTREIGKYIACTVKDAGEFCTAMDPENLGFTPLVPPADPADMTNLMHVKHWKIAYRTYSDATDQCAKATSQAFAVVLGQCSPTIVDRLKASTQWDTISNDDDLIGMLRLVQTSMFTVATSKNGMHSLITDDWKKMGRCLQYLHNTANLNYTLGANGTWVIRWWMDASYGVHPDMKSHMCVIRSSS